MSISEDQEIERAILTALYEAWAEGQNLSLRNVREAGSWSERSFRHVVDRLARQEGLIVPLGSWSIYELTTPGVLYAEEKGFPPKEEVDKHQRARTEILKILAAAYESTEEDDDPLFREICDGANLDIGTCQHNITLLIDANYVEATSTSSFKITLKGLNAVRQWREHQSLTDELKQVSSMPPHPHGRALQKLLARAIEQQGWSQEEGARSSHEEMDIVVFRGSLFYLIECKWEAEPIQAKVIRELFGKLGNRANVHGLVVSMSGFTSGAIEQAKDYAGQRIILLFGPEDVRDLIEHRRTYDEFLDEKHKALVMQRKVIWQ
jgi:predicted transcriptional regulator